jgi:hypothetical protein
MHPRDVLFVMPSLSIQMVILPLFFNFVILTLLFEIEAQVACALLRAFQKSKPFHN